MIFTPSSTYAGAKGFTLVEVLVALSILGGAMFVLVNSHFTALQLHVFTQEEVDGRMLLESTVARAELGIGQEEMSGGGDFGARYPGFSWTYEAVPLGDTERPMLMDTQFYRVTTTLSTPNGESRTLEFLTFVNPEMQTVQVTTQ